MITAKTTREAIVANLQDDGTILKDFGTLAGFATAVTISPPTSLGALIALILSAAGAGLSASTRIFSRVSPENKPERVQQVHSYEKFTILYYVACQRAFLKAVSDSKGLKKLLKSNEKNVDPNYLTSLQERIVAIDDAEVRFHFSVSPDEYDIQLFSLYSEWLRDVLSVCGRVEAATIASDIEEQANKNLYIDLTSSDKDYKWIREYLALTSLKVQKKKLDTAISQLNELHVALKGWKNEPDKETGKKEQNWKRYREHLKTLPDQTESMYNEEFGVSRVFVTPEVTYHRAGLRGLPDRQANPTDTGALLGALVSNRLDGSDLIIICGGPGSGKSTLCRMMISEIAKDEEMHPVFCKLRSCKEGAEISSFIEDTLVKEGVINSISELLDIPNVVIVLDGFDELVMASRTKLHRFFSSLLDEIHNGPLRNARVIVAGRDTLFPGGEGLHRGSHVIAIRPFDQKRVAKWSEHWRKIHTKGEGSRFHPETLLSDKQVKKEGIETKLSDLQQLVCWPLTLHLLSRLHTAGLFNLSQKHTAIDRAYLFRGILHETALRQQEKTTDKKGRLTPEKMREFLRAIAGHMYLKGIDSMEITDLQPIVKLFFEGATDEIAIAELAEVAIVNCPEIQKGEDSGFEFVHKSFSEFLVGESFAIIIDRILHEVQDIDEQNVWHLSLSDAEKELVNILGCRIIPPDTQDMLEPMLGSYTIFKKGTRVEDRVPDVKQIEGLQRAIRRFSELYKKLCMYGAIETVQKTAHENIVTFEQHSNYCVGLVLLGTASARRLRLMVKKCDTPLFPLEPFPGAFWRWASMIVGGGVPIGQELSKRLYAGASLCVESDGRKASDWDLPVKIGYLHDVSGYGDGLRTALLQSEERQFSIISQLVLLLMSLVNTDNPKDSENHQDIKGSILHFLEHFDELTSDIYHNLHLELVENGYLPPEMTSLRWSFHRSIEQLISPTKRHDLHNQNETVFHEIARRLCVQDMPELVNKNTNLWRFTADEYRESRIIRKSVFSKKRD